VSTRRDNSLDVLDRVFGDRHRLLVCLALSASQSGYLSQPVELVGTVSAVPLIVSISETVDPAFLAEQAQR
jgi:hypothetical protein